MAVSKRPVRAVARAGKTMQHQRLPAEVLEALATEAWFRERIAEVAPTEPAAKPTKESLFDAGIELFLDDPSARARTDWPTPGRQWPKVTFWVSDTLLERCERVAREAGITRTQVIAQALLYFCECRIPPALVEFRREAFKRARELYRELQCSASKPKRKSLRR